MDPFSSFDLFRRRVDQMFADFDQQMFGSSGLFDSPFHSLQQQQGEGGQTQQQQSIGHEKQTGLSSTPMKEEERIIPHNTRSSSSSSPSNTDHSLATRPSSSNALSLFSWPSTTLPQMKLDIMEEKDKYLVHADVPGFTKDQIKLNIKDGMLSVSADQSNVKEEKDEQRKYHRIERSSGSVYRSIRLPEHIKEEQISASCENGVLKIVLPKEEVTEAKKERQITIQ